MTVSVPMLRSSRVLLVGSAEWLETFAERVSASAEASVTAVKTKSEALAAVRDGTVDCLVGAYALEDATGVELVREVRAETETLPVVLGAASGSEAVASEAIDAGVSEYVPVREPIDGAIDELLRRTEQAVRSARRTDRKSVV